MYNSTNTQQIFEALNAALLRYADEVTGIPLLSLDSSIFTAPTDNERRRWLSVKDSLKPHLLGQMPARIKLAFPHEDVNQRTYREQVYCSKSQSLLMQAIDNVYKIVQSDDFVVHFDATLSELLTRVFISGENLEGERLQKQVLSVLYKARVLDPNGYYGIVWRGENQNERNGFTFDIVVYPSENIVVKNDRLMVFALPNGAGVGASAWRAYTEGAIIDFNAQGEIVGNTLFHQNARGILCHCLGGKPTIDEEYNDIMQGSRDNAYSRTLAAGTTSVIEFNQSDFSFATSQLDALEIANSERDVVIYLHAHPTKVAVEILCNDCEGTGVKAKLGADGYPLYNTTTRDGIEIGDPVPVTHACGKCKGKGILNTGSQDVITVPNSAPMNISETPKPLSSLKDAYVAYVTPDINSAKFLQDSVMAAMNECKEMLNLHRLEDFSQSGVSKSIDREAGFTRLRAIAEGIGGIFANILKMSARADVGFQPTAAQMQRMRTRLDSVRVSIPSYFDMRTTSEAESAYFENITEKDHDTRYNERLNILKKANRTPSEIAAFDIAYDYTDGLNLASKTELLELVGAGLISEADAYAAMNVATWLKRLKRDYFARMGAQLDFAQLVDYKGIRTQLDAIKATYEEKRAARATPPMGMLDAMLNSRQPTDASGDDSNDDDEDERITE